MESEMEMSMQERELNEEDVREEFLPLPQAKTRYRWDDRWDNPIHYSHSCCRAYYLEGGRECDCITTNVMYNCIIEVQLPRGNWANLTRKDGVWGYYDISTGPHSTLTYEFIAVV